MWWLLEYTPVGRYLRAIGANAEASRLSGINVGKWIFISFLISGVIYGLGGVLYASQVGPSLTFGQSFVLPALAACFLGSTQIRPGTFNVWGTLIAIYVLAAGVKGLQLVTGAPWLADMFNGIALLLAVGFGGLATEAKSRSTEEGCRSIGKRRTSSRDQRPRGRRRVSSGLSALDPGFERILSSCASPEHQSDWRMDAPKRSRNGRRLEAAIRQAGLPLPEIGNDDALLRVERCGLCGTDLDNTATA